MGFCWGLLLVADFFKHLSIYGSKTDMVLNFGYSCISLFLSVQLSN